MVFLRPCGRGVHSDLSIVLLGTGQLGGGCIPVTHICPREPPSGLFELMLETKRPKTPLSLLSSFPSSGPQPRQPQPGVVSSQSPPKLFEATHACSSLSGGRCPSVVPGELLKRGWHPLSRSSSLDSHRRTWALESSTARFDSGAYPPPGDCRMEE